MSADLEEQEDELLALQSIFDSEEFLKNESNVGGEIRVSVELPAGFTVTLKEGEDLREYELSFLPPLFLTFGLPEDYPSSSPPSFTLTCSWLTHSQLCALRTHLIDLYQTTGGAVVLFSWVQFLKEETLQFLDIRSRLELSSDEQSGPPCSQDQQNAALSEPVNKKQASTSGSDNQTCNSPEPCTNESPGVRHPVPFHGDDQMHGSSASGSQSGLKNLDCESEAQKSSKGLQQNVPDTDDQTETSSQKPDIPPLVSSDRTNEGDFLSDGEASDSLSRPLGQSEEAASGAAASPPARPKESNQKKDQTHSGPCLTRAQALMSQLLIYNKVQKEKMFATTMFECGVCFLSWMGSHCVQLQECGHIYCQSCLAQFCTVQITEGNVRGVTCPEVGCAATPTPAQVKMLVSEELFNRYDRLLLQSTLDLMADVVYCPRHSCGSAVILEKGSRAALCVCGYAFCVSCKKTYHGTEDCYATKKSKKQNGTQQDLADLPHSQEGLRALWDDYTSGSKQRRRVLESRYGRTKMQGTIEDCLSEDWISVNSKNCPHCYCRIEKVSGCNMMCCSQCGQRFCWACLVRLPTTKGSHHFSGTSCSGYDF